MSPLAQGRGLKFYYMLIGNLCIDVAPRAGAWIEMVEWLKDDGQYIVAPRAGAWIEMQ